MNEARFPETLEQFLDMLGRAVLVDEYVAKFKQDVPKGLVEAAPPERVLNALYNWCQANHTILAHLGSAAAEAAGDLDHAGAIVSERINNLGQTFPDGLSFWPTKGRWLLVTGVALQGEAMIRFLSFLSELVI